MAVIEINDDSFSKEIEENKNIIVKYFADWCGTCRLFAPKFKRLSEDERFKDVVFLDVNAEKNATARKAGNVKTLPTFVAFKNGVFLDAISSSREESVIELIQKLQA